MDALAVSAANPGRRSAPSPVPEKATNRPLGLTPSHEIPTRLVCAAQIPILERPDGRVVIQWTDASGRKRQRTLAKRRADGAHRALLRESADDHPPGSRPPVLPLTPDDGVAPDLARAA